jgi:hypothetical protein
MENPDQRGWRALGGFLRERLALLPHAAPPDTLCWEDPAESRQKERWEMKAIEREWSAHVRTALEDLISLRPEGGLTDDVLFLMRARLEWARLLCECLADTPASGGGLSWPRPAGHSLGQAALWLLVEVYESGFAVPRKWWDHCSAEDYY